MVSVSKRVVDPRVDPGFCVEAYVLRSNRPPSITGEDLKRKSPSLHKENCSWLFLRLSVEHLVGA